MGKHQDWYNALISSRKERQRESGIYYEKHHVIPRSLGGDDSQDNLVWLTPREHFIAHLLLVKLTTGQNQFKMKFALNMMLVASPDHEGPRYTPCSRLYDFARQCLSEAWSETRRGHVAWNRGIPRPDHVKQAVSQANKGKTPWNKGRERTPEERQKMKDGWARRKALGLQVKKRKSDG